MTGRPTEERELIYVGDPMCSWCWGFQSWGVRGFPALLARHDRQLTLVAHDYAPLERVLTSLAAWRVPTTD